MEYTHKTVAEIIEKYAELRRCLRELNDAKNSKDGAVLGWVSGHYERANKAIEFLKTIPPELRKELRISDLETEVDFFANTHVSL